MPKSDLLSAKFKTVPLRRIDIQDETFRITTRTDIDDLLASLRHDGLLNPPLVIGKASGFNIVSGFRRIAACKKLGREDIPVRVLHPDLNPLKCLRFAIADNTHQRPLNLIETSRALQKLSGYLGTGKRLSESASILGLPSNLSIINKIKDLCLLPEIIQDGILKDAISLSMAVELKTLAPDSAIAIARLFTELKMSLNKQREIVTLVKEIARRDGISQQKVLEDNQLQQIINDEDSDRGQKARELRAYLRQRRFPHMVLAESRFEFHRKKLNLGHDIKLIPPRDFEGSTYTVNLSFRDITQLKTLHILLDKIIKHPSLRKIIER